jgi:hypothetical protein
MNRKGRECASREPGPVANLETGQSTPGASSAVARWAKGPGAAISAKRTQFYRRHNCGRVDQPLRARCVGGNARAGTSRKQNWGDQMRKITPVLSIFGAIAIAAAVITLDSNEARALCDNSVDPNGANCLANGGNGVPLLEFDELNFCYWIRQWQWQLQSRFWRRSCNSCSSAQCVAWSRKRQREREYHFRQWKPNGQHSGLEF